MVLGARTVTTRTAISIELARTRQVFPGLTQTPRDMRWVAARSGTTGEAAEEVGPRAVQEGTVVSGTIEVEEFT